MLVIWCSTHLLKNDGFYEKFCTRFAYVAFTTQPYREMTVALWQSKIFFYLRNFFLLNDLVIMT